MMTPKEKCYQMLKEHFDNQKTSSAIWSHLSDKEKEIQALDKRLSKLEDERNDR